MRILHVIPSVSPARGGPSRVVRTLSAAQSAAGHQVTVATTDDDGAGRRAVALSESTEDGVTYRTFPRQSGFYSVSLPLARWLSANVERFDAVHVHALFSFPATAASWAAAAHRKPFVVRPLGTLNRWGVENRRPLFKKVSIAAVESRILTAAAAVQFTSEQERDHAAGLGIPFRPVVIPNPVDEPWDAHRRRDDATVLFLGRIDRIKGLDILIAALRHLPAARLVIAGNGHPSLVASLREQAERMGVQAEWAGAVEERGKRELLARASVFVLPSHSENFGIAAGEAMAAGVPVVVSTGVAIHAEVSRAGAGLVTPCEELPLADTIRRLLEDKDLAAQCGESGRRLVAERYSAAAVTEQLIGLYKEISA